MSSSNPDPSAQCPVDHNTRSAWLEAAAQHKKNGQPTTTPHPPQHQSITSQTRPVPSHFSLDTLTWQTLPILPRPHSRRNPSLSRDREISTIPRAVSSPSAYNSAERAALPPANSEHETGQDGASGNWVYPSQSQFFAAMQRKGHAAAAEDMSTIVPIHNAVNERAWREIKAWEAGWGAERCGGPKLVSFSGDSRNLTPRARWNALLGYSAPFDRHDWVVERCAGEKVEYVIDFYKGKDAAQGNGLSFYLDVRPKLNSWEGWKMRAAKTLGW